MPITPIVLTLSTTNPTPITAGENDDNLNNLKTASEELDAQKQPINANILTVKNNLSAIVAPIATDDTGSGYEIGSRWVDTVLDTEHVCLDATASSAVWKETTISGAGGGDLVSTNNLSDVANASTSRDNLGLTIGTDVQAEDAGLTSIAGLTTLADRMLYTTASDVYAVAVLTNAGRALLDDADATAQRVTLGLVIGTDIQAYDVNTAKTDVVQSFTKGQSGFTVGAPTGALDFSLGNNFYVAPTANVTIANPTNIVGGQSGTIQIDASTYTVSFGTYWKFAGGVAPTLTGNCILSYYTYNGVTIIASEVIAYA